MSFALTPLQESFVLTFPISPHFVSIISDQAIAIIEELYQAVRNGNPSAIPDLCLQLTTIITKKWEWSVKFLKSTFESLAETAARVGNSVALEHLANSYGERPYDVTQLFKHIDNQKLSLIDLAFVHGKEETVRFLSGQGATVSPTFFDIMIENQDMDALKTLYTWEVPNLLCGAAEKNWVEGIIFLAGLGAPLSPARFDTISVPLHTAASFGSLKAVNALLDLHADATQVLRTKTPICIAADQGHTDIIRLLKSKAGVDIDEPIPTCTYDVTPLYSSVYRKQPESVRTLVELGAKVNTINAITGTPFSYAVQLKCWAIIFILMPHVDITIELNRLAFKQLKVSPELNALQILKPPLTPARTIISLHWFCFQTLLKSWKDKESMLEFDIKEKRRRTIGFKINGVLKETTVPRKLWWPLRSGYCLFSGNPQPEEEDDNEVEPGLANDEAVTTPELASRNSM